MVGSLNKLRKSRKSKSRTSRRSVRRRLQRRSKRSSRRGQRKKGGDIIGRGAFGCVVKPNISCPNTISSDKYISKLVDADTGDDEYDIVENLGIKQIKDYDKYFIVNIDRCVIYDERIPRDDYNACKEIKNTDNFVNNIQIFGGLSLDKIRMIGSELRNIREMVPYYYQLLEILNILQYNDIAHCDIKEGNIVIDINEKKLRLIDFGLSCHINEVKNNYKLFRNNFGYAYEEGYYIWPAEATLFEYDNIGNIKKIKDITDKFIATQYNGVNEYIASFYNEHSHYLPNLPKIEMIRMLYKKSLDSIKEKFNDRKRSLIDIKTEINSGVDLYSVGITIIIDLYQIIEPTLPRSDLKLIEDLFILIINEIFIKQDSSLRINIEQFKRYFVELCKKHGVFL